MANYPQLKISLPIIMVKRLFASTASSYLLCFLFLLLPLHFTNMYKNNLTVNTSNNNVINSSNIATVIFNNTQLPPVTLLVSSMLMSTKWTPTSPAQHKPPIPPASAPAPTPLPSAAPVTPTLSLTSAHDPNLVSADLLVVLRNAWGVIMPNSTIIYAVSNELVKPSATSKLYTHTICAKLTMKDKLTFKATVATKQQECFKMISISIKDPK